jgi:hypothetical protein
MQDLVKLARLIETPNHEDSIRDRFGYQGCYVDLVLNKDEWQDWPPTAGYDTMGAGAATNPAGYDPVVPDGPPTAEAEALRHYRERAAKNSTGL